jgi:hypothetical protein
MSRQGIFATLRRACATVARQARHVRVAEERIASYAESLPIERIGAPPPDEAVEFLTDEEDLVAFFLTLNAVNFGSGWFPHLIKKPGESGFVTIAGALRDRFLQNGPLRPGELVAMDTAGCGELFAQPLDKGPREELMALFAKALRDLGACVTKNHGGSFRVLVDAAHGHAETLVGVLVAMPFYQDEADYHGIRVPFYKRAQITAADLHTAFKGQGPGAFADMDSLTLFADNLVPHVLRIDQILVFEQGLLKRIDQEDLIPSGSDEEIEIRACAVTAVEAIVKQLSDVNAAGLDNLLWHRGRGRKYKARPRHRTRCTFY